MLPTKVKIDTCCSKVNSTKGKRNGLSDSFHYVRNNNETCCCYALLSCLQSDVSNVNKKQFNSQSNQLSLHMTYSAALQGEQLVSWDKQRFFLRFL